MSDNCNVCVHIVQFWSINKIKNKQKNIPHSIRKVIRDNRDYVSCVVNIL